MTEDRKVKALLLIRDHISTGTEMSQFLTSSDGGQLIVPSIMMEEDEIKAYIDAGKYCFWVCLMNEPQDH